MNPPTVLESFMEKPSTSRMPVNHSRQIPAGLMCCFLVAAISTQAATFNVKDYGALGDDRTDNTAAFAKCMDAILAAGGWRMFLPDGIYRGRIAQLNIENAGPGQTDARNEWQKVVHDINDPNHLGTGDITWWVVLGNVGAVDSFTRNGAGGIRTRRIGAAP